MPDLLKKLPTLFISHGGGPWPYIPEMKIQYANTAAWLAQIPATLPLKPKAIISISGHWEEKDFSISTAKSPEMIFDYSGFPKHTYKIKYPAAGSLDLAVRVQQLLSAAGINNLADAAHGFDHGTFVPLELMYPNANVPIVSMSHKLGYNPLEHWMVGQALQPLRTEGILIIGSGLSYHNMRGFGSTAGSDVSSTFNQWLTTAVTEKNIEQRKQLLLNWEQAPAARLAHPQEDHLIPLMIVAGAAGADLGVLEFQDRIMGIDMASYRFSD